jgi:hypothetical protein
MTALVQDLPSAGFMSYYHNVVFGATLFFQNTFAEVEPYKNHLHIHANFTPTLIHGILKRKISKIA